MVLEHREDGGVVRWNAFDALRQEVRAQLVADRLADEPECVRGQPSIRRAAGLVQLEFLARAGPFPLRPFPCSLPSPLAFDKPFGIGAVGFVCRNQCGARALQDRAEQALCFHRIRPFQPALKAQQAVKILAPRHACRE